MKVQEEAWRTVRFGSLVRQVKDSTNPVQDGLERFVAGEHMDSRQLHITRWGEVKGSSLGPAFHRRFRPGQVLYGSRRTYLRKVAYAEFEGVCANTTFVMESADPGELIPDILPFLMMADSFHHHSKYWSRGSVNPYVNWPDIAKYEFLLPPPPEQRRIAELLWSFERASRAKAAALEAARQAELTALAELYDESEWPVRRVDEVGEVQLGMKREPKVHQGSDLRPYLRVANVGDDELFLDDVLEMNFAPSAFAKYALRPKDVLLNEGQSLEYVGRAAMYRGEIEDCCFQMTLLRFRASDEVLPEFALGWFRRCQRLGAFARVAKRTTSMAHLPAGLLSAQPIPVPPLSVQQRVVERLEAARGLRTALVEDLTQTRNLMQRTLNVLLQGPGASADRAIVAGADGIK
ncbi:restriction endonuclease subunit S [Streptomyces sp. NWU339]|uniref:restriction endonuclease subunit S n=1 Tax=Streptomyces sp. NWU339 TaxID=2185284 RepID=UPI0015E81062|nr:restriction endonuclease subunit S [Streptomyces sp. NWU339]